MVTLAIIQTINLIIITVFLFFLNSKINKKEKIKFDSVNSKQPSPYQITIENKNDEVSKAIIFGYNKRFLTKNFGSDDGILVKNSMCNSSYIQLLQQSMSMPFETSLIRIQSTNTKQVTTMFLIESSDANGQSCSVPLITANYFSANQFQSSIIDIPYGLKVDGNTELVYEVQPKTTVVITFFPASKVNTSNLLIEKNILRRYTSQFDYMANSKIKFTSLKFKIQQVLSKIKNKIASIYSKIKLFSKKD